MSITHKELIEPKVADLHIKVWPWLHEQIKDKAKQDKMSVSDWVREKMLQAVDR